MVKEFSVPNTVLTSLEGLVETNPSLTLIKEDKVIFRQPSTSKLSVLSGGGAGHEPTHAGFIGKGLLTGAISGELFASPSTKQILNGIKVIGGDNSKGTLLIVKNYTGDVLHFGLAAERAKSLGHDVEVVVIGDDVSVGRSKGGLVGRRGLAGVLFVHKTVGAYAEYYKEHDVKKAAQLANAVNDNIATIGVSLDHAKVPGKAFESALGDNEIELGMGIHNEPGFHKLSPIPGVSELLETHLLPKILDSTDADRSFVKFNKDDEIVVLINNLGGVSNLILGGITKLTVDILKSKYGIKPVRVYQGALMTACNGEGFSVTLFNVSAASKATSGLGFKSVLELLDAETDCAAWPVVKHSTNAPSYDKSILVSSDSETYPEVGNFSFDHFQKYVQSGVDEIIKQEPHITKLDTLVGDGDCGTTLVSGGQGIVDHFSALKSNSIIETLSKLSEIVEDKMGGTSGGLYSIFISGLSQGLIKHGVKGQDIDYGVLAKALKHAQETLYKYTNARVGDSTVIDALEPFVEELNKSLDFNKAVKAAEDGALKTGSIEAKFGRASYVENSSDIADPGAIGLVAFLKGVQAGL
ncbi:hypothetical protein WICPIJ_008788 [Wickerhamomyces pijperi]|uniref:Dihydroxyacetone kinase n=1 Tax=Wickerhamomyces pijperi TaxID=599730 RepID=A0A9P8PWL2_WICPI|nr:hypothetical protein WICPIJ_008788 [Wickerhamomyces pijperi]